MTDQADANVDLEISKGHTESYGWHLEHYTSSNPFETDAIYILDYRNPCLVPKLITVPRAMIDSLEKTGTPTLFACGITGALHKMRTRSTDALENELALFLSHYVIESRAYAMWNQKKQSNHHMHAIINIYPDRKSSRGGVIRPIIASTPETLLTPTYVLDVSLQTSRADSKSPTFAGALFKPVNCKLPT
jgi:hypothetical protein